MNKHRYFFPTEEVIKVMETFVLPEDKEKQVKSFTFP